MTENIISYLFLMYCTNNKDILSEPSKSHQIVYDDHEHPDDVHDEEGVDVSVVLLGNHSTLTQSEMDC